MLRSALISIKDGCLFPRRSTGKHALRVSAPRMKTDGGEIHSAVRSAEPFYDARKAEEEIEKSDQIENVFDSVGTGGTKCLQLDGEMLSMLRFNYLGKMLHSRAHTRTRAVVPSSRWAQTLVLSWFEWLPVINECPSVSQQAAAIFRSMLRI